MIKLSDSENDCKSFFFDLGIILPDLDNTLDANDIGCSEPSGMACNRPSTVPNPYGDASQVVYLIVRNYKNSFS